MFLELDVTDNKLWKRQGRQSTVGTWRTRLIHWKLSSSDASGLCSATTTILSSCSTDTENTAILEHITYNNTVTDRMHSPQIGQCIDMTAYIMWRSIKLNLWCFFFTSPCTQTSWAPLLVQWQPHHQHCVSAHWPPSAHPSSPQQTQGCPDMGNRKYNLLDG